MASADAPAAEEPCFLCMAELVLRPADVPVRAASPMRPTVGSVDAGRGERWGGGGGALRDGVCAHIASRDLTGWREGGLHWPRCSPKSGARPLQVCCALLQRPPGCGDPRSAARCCSVDGGHAVGRRGCVRCALPTAMRRSQPSSTSPHHPPVSRHLCRAARCCSARYRSAIPAVLCDPISQRKAGASCQAAALACPASPHHAPAYSSPIRAQAEVEPEHGASWFGVRCPSCHVAYCDGCRGVSRPCSR
jgi:hypothetical protein